jgi:hypothetical protein
VDVKVTVECCDDRGDPYPPNNYRCEVEIGGIIFLPDFR